MSYVILIVLSSACVAAIAVYCAVRSRRRRSDGVSHPPGADRPVPVVESFEIRVKPANGKLVVSGRLAVFVAPGAQYSVWRQFPRAIQFHLIESPGDTDRELPDHTLSISDTKEVYARFAQMPCARIVEKEFSMDLLDMYPEIFNAAGHYTIVGTYAGLKTEPVSFILAECSSPDL